MQLPSKEDLKTLGTAEYEVAVSIYLPTHEAGAATRENHIRFKNRLQEAGERLREKARAATLAFLAAYHWFMLPTGSVTDLTVAGQRYLLVSVWLPVGSTISRAEYSRCAEANVSSSSTSPACRTAASWNTRSTGAARSRSISAVTRRGTGISSHA